jgi:type IX secretion system PorP/SprF family membrane protein
MRGFISIAMLFLMHVMNAQPLARYNLYPFNRDFANPAATGLSNCLELNVTDQHQWAGIEDAPNIQSFSIQKGLGFSETRKHGLGANFVRDANGPSKSLGGELLYSFQMLIGRSRTTWVSFGLSGNFEQRKLDESGFTPVFDPGITGGVVQEIAYNASTGMYVYSTKYFAGLALYNLLPVNNNLGQGYGGDRYFISFQGGYLFTSRTSSASLQTSIQGSLGNHVYQFDLNNNILFNNNLWLGLTLRKYLGDFESAGQNAILFVGYHWKNWSFCYDYNFDINGTQFHHYGTHQLSLGFKICKDSFNCPAY